MLYGWSTTHEFSYMKKSLILALLASSFMIVACGNKDAATSTSGTKPAATAKDANAKTVEEKPRQATYDPNLKPAQIVWDSPEKQKAWEARQVELKKAASAKK